MITLLIITCCIFIIYNIFILTKFGVPESLSATSYLLEKKFKQHWWFTIICVNITIGLLPNWIEIGYENTQCLVFLACGGIMFIAVSPFFKDGLDKPVHYGSGIITALCFILWFLLNGYWFWLLYVVFLSVILIIWKPKCYTYFIEIVAYFISCVFLLKI